MLILIDLSELALSTSLDIEHNDGASLGSDHHILTVGRDTELVGSCHIRTGVQLVLKADWEKLLPGAYVPDLNDMVQTRRDDTPLIWSEPSTSDIVQVGVLDMMDDLPIGKVPESHVFQVG